jgi:hypothetical protein
MVIYPFNTIQTGTRKFYCIGAFLYLLLPQLAVENNPGSMSIKGGWIDLPTGVV